MAMAEFPFQLLIKRAPPEKRTESLTCTALLRAIPGRREVYDALWNERAVIVKVFSHKISASRHLKKEWRGLGTLQARGLSSPVPLFYGRTVPGNPYGENNQLAVVVEKIPDSLTALDAFSSATGNKTADPAQKLDLLILVCRELAKQHSKGAVQKDLHLGNFLLKGEKIFMIDPAQIYFSSHETGKKKSLSQIALLICSLPENGTKFIAELCQQYASERGWHFNKSDMALFEKYLTAYKKRAVRKSLKKCLRTNKRHLRIKADSCVAVFDKGFCQGAVAVEFLKQIDALMDAGRILKDGNTCYVCRLTWNDRDVAVKRYNHKGFIHSLRHTIKRSRARRGWLYAHRLRILNVATPKPLAYIEKYKGALVWQSYFVTEYVEGQKLYDFLRDDTVGEQQRSKVTGQVMELLDKLGKHRISHGDLKHSNILITADGPSIIDLDAMTAHRCRWVYRVRRTKDLQRLALPQVAKHLPNLSAP